MKTQEELEAMSEAEYTEWVRTEQWPNDLAGFQCVVKGSVKRGDLLVKYGKIVSWADDSIGRSIDAVKSVYGECRFYRRMPVDSHESIYQKLVEDKKAEPVYRPLEDDEVIQEGDEYLSPVGCWCYFGNSVSSVLKNSCMGSYQTRTTRPKPQPSGRREDGPLANTKPLDPKGDAGKKKPQLQLIPPVLNRETAKALAFGAYHPTKNYGPWNWREEKIEIMDYIGAIRRHIDCILEGEDIDLESGAHHLGHIAANCGIVLDAQKHGTLVDNRPNKTAEERR